MTREPDRYEEKAREVVASFWPGKHARSQNVELVAAALRAAESSALERAAQEVEAAKSSDRFAVTQAILARRVRSLASPAAAPAAEPRLGVCDYCIMAGDPHPRSEECGNWRPAPPSEPVAPEPTNDPQECPQCAGTGCAPNHLSDTCGACGGTGMRSADESDDESPDPIAPPLLPRVLAALEWETVPFAPSRAELQALAAELRRYIAEMEGKT